VTAHFLLGEEVAFARRHGFWLVDRSAGGCRQRKLPLVLPASATGFIPKTFLNAIFTLDFSEAHHYNPETNKRFGEI
jgi:hypothetical protein